MAETKLYYVGDDFYGPSGTIMSPIYQEDTNARYDWGFVSRDLREGNSVSIRQATAEEKANAYAMLVRLQRERKEREERWAREEIAKASPSGERQP